MKHGDKKTVAKARKELERNRHLARALGLVIVVAVAFVAGFFVRGESAFLAGLGFPVTAEEAGPASSGSPSKSTFNSVSARVSEVEDVLAANSMDHYDLDAATAQTLEAVSYTHLDVYKRQEGAEPPEEPTIALEQVNQQTLRITMLLMFALFRCV